jgi:hypothetical protein
LSFPSGTGETPPRHSAPPVLPLERIPSPLSGTSIRCCTAYCAIRSARCRYRSNLQMGRFADDVGKGWDSPWPCPWRREDEFVPHSTDLGLAHCRQTPAGEGGTGVEGKLDCRGLGRPTRREIFCHTVCAVQFVKLASLIDQDDVSNPNLIVQSLTQLPPC